MKLLFKEIALALQIALTTLAFNGTYFSDNLMASEGGGDGGLE